MAIIKIDLKSNAAEIVRMVEEFPAKMGKGIAKAMDDVNQRTIGVIQKDRLNFPKQGPTQPDGLRHISGRLFRSPQATAAVASGNTVKSAIGSEVGYAAVHEFGFTGTQSVRSFVRHQASRDIHARGPRGGKKGKTSSGIAVVHPFTRRVNFPARAPFQRGITSNTQDYADTISAKIVETWQGATP